MKVIRYVLGKIVLFLDSAFSPKPEFVRSTLDQAKVDHETSGWTLYHLQTCPFCIKVRREMKRLAITIPLKEINQDPIAYSELMAGGKIDQYPCLRIGDQWMYESSAINELLRKRFGK